ncbi:universal stress protein [Streptomyces sp. NPDC059176]|uniref:universal stress protein n=1 Tax=Streptomyces sp. NPDC059176 TaxID=3346758 RepID=UPI0036AC0CD1
MELPVVVGVDGSDAGLRAVDWATDEAARHGLPLRLVYASRWERYDLGALVHGRDRRSGQESAEDVVAAAAERAGRRDPDVPVTTDALAEDTVAALLAEGRRASMLITGSRGHGALTERLLGSVSLAVATRAPCPVVVVRGDPDGTGGAHGTVLLGVPDATHGPAAVEFALREAAARGAELDAVRTWRCPAHAGADHPRRPGDPCLPCEKEAATLVDAALDLFAARAGTVVRSSTVEGAPQRVLQRRSADADLLVVGTGRRAKSPDPHLGRTAHSVLHHAHCPVAVVPQPE